LRERVNRIAFRTLLRERLLAGELTHKTKWKDFLIENRADVRLLNMMDPSQPGTSAHELFEHFMGELGEKHKVIKGLIKHQFKKVGFKMTE
jgi:ferritin